MVSANLDIVKHRDAAFGEIPIDWAVESLSSNSSLKARIGWQGLTTSEYLTNGEYYLITGTDFDNGRINWTGCHFVSKFRFDQDKNIQVKKDDILVTKDGTIGKVAIIDKFFNKATLNSGVFVIRPLRNAYHPKYMYYVLMSRYFRDFLDKLAAGSTISHLYQKDFVNFNFLLPTLNEQKQIATVLSDTDKLIESIEKLIDKKKQIKLGAMQQLLTSKTRVKGYNDPWENIILSDLVYIQNGWSFKSENFRKSGIPLIRISNIDNNRINMEDTVFYQDLDLNSHFLVKSNDILVAMSGATTGKIGIYRYQTKAFLNQRVGKFVIKNNLDLDNEYFYQLLLSNLYIEQIDKYLAQGAQPNISGKNIETMRFFIPNNLAEQKAIAKILSDMDNEIEVLEQKLNKYKQIKKGMMQELLTGRIRLV